MPMEPRRTYNYGERLTLRRTANYPPWQTLTLRTVPSRCGRTPSPVA